MSTPKRRGPDYPLVVVEWVDSARGESWRFVGDLKHGISSVFSVGWLYHRSKEAIRLAPHISLETDGTPDQLVGDMLIPRRAIVRTTTLSRRSL